MSESAVEGIRQQAVASPTFGKSSVNADRATAPLRLVSIAVRGWRWFVGFPLGCVIVVVLGSLLLPPKYTTTVSFSPVTTQASAGTLVGLASQFGVALPGQDATASPEFFADLVHGPEILQRLATKSYKAVVNQDTVLGTLVDFYSIDEGDNGRTLAAAIDKLGDDILRVRAKRTTGVVSITVTTKWPDLSREIGEELVRLVEAYNLKSHQARADAEYRFMSQRLDTTELELRSAENRLQAFLQSNREFRSDPRLLFEYDRLSRDVSMRQSVFTTLMQNAENARIEAVRNTPSLALVQPPAQPLRSDPLQLPLRVVVTLMFAMIVTVAIVLVRDYVTGTTPADREAFGEVGRSLAAARQSLLLPLNKILRLPRR
jgi:uncharacterized protein involved in exopolysaccharide biosynthesis